MAFLYPWGNTQQLNLDWILQKIKELEAGSGGNVDLTEVANALISASYAVQAYDRSDIVFRDGKLYRANQAIPAPGEAWTPAHWDEILLGDTVSNLVQYVSALSNDQIANNSNVSGTHTSDALNNLYSAITSLNNRYPTDIFANITSLIASISQNSSQSIGMCSITSVLMLQLSGVGRPGTLIWKYLPITGYDEIEYFVFCDAIEAYGYIKISTGTVSRVWASKYIAGDTITRRFVQAAGRIVNAKNGATLGVVLDKPIASGTSLTITFSTGEADNFYPATPELYTVMRNADADINTLIDKTGNITILSQREDGTLLITVPFIATLSAATASASGVVGLIEANLDITFS